MHEACNVEEAVVAAEAYGVCFHEGGHLIDGANTLVNERESLLYVGFSVAEVGAEAQE